MHQERYIHIVSLHYTDIINQINNILILTVSTYDLYCRYDVQYIIYFHNAFSCVRFVFSPLHFELIVLNLVRPVVYKNIFSQNKTSTYVYLFFFKNKYGLIFIFYI